MRSVGLVVVILAALYFWTAPLCGCSSRTRSFVAAMKSDLRNLASQQEIYFSDYRTYSDDHAALAYWTSEGVTVDILESDARGWSARARHWGFDSGTYEGMDCVTAHGEVTTIPSTTIRGRTPEPGEIACDMDGWSSGQSRWARWRWNASR